MTESFSEILKRHEGYSDTVYLDTKGVPTGGYGHAFLAGSPIPREVADILFWHDTKSARDDFEKLHLDHLNPARRDVVIMLLFNLGLTKLRRFTKFLAALREENYPLAADELLDSKWAADVKIHRATELANAMRTGLWG